MDEKRYDDAKKEIRSVLLTYQSCITLQEFLKSYKNILGERLPSKTLGFPSDVEFLQSMPDVVNVCTDSYGKVLLTGIADESSEHIQKLVRKQRKSHPRGLKSNNNFQRPKFPNESPVIKELTFIPGTLRAEIMKVMSMYHDGVAFTNFPIAYHRIFNKYLSLVRGLDSLENMISLIPELEIKSINNEKFICFTNNDAHNQVEASVTMKNISSSKCTKDKECKKLLTDCTSSNIHKSGITEDVIQNFQLVLKKCPEGITDIYLPSLYEHLTKKSFDLHELGYTSIIELVDKLPHVFKRVLNPKGGNNWIILPADAKMKHFSNERNSKKSLVGIPSDAASPSLQFINPTMPQNLNLNEHVPVFVSAINNPNLFWFQLQLEDTIEEFKNFENDMGYFYNYHADSKYIMHDSDIAIGSTCVVCCPDDKKWYRAIIKSIPSIKCVNVSFVDYGSRQNIPRNNVYYVRNKYHDYPAQAFKAHLAGLKPTKNATTWDAKAQQRFIQLCKCVVLMAYLNPVDKDTFSAYLCDTTEDSDVDIHINDTLVKEGFAELCFENQFDENHLQSDCKESAPNGISIDIESSFSSESSEHNQYVTSEETYTSSETEMFNSKQKLVLSPKNQVDRFKSNAVHAEGQVQRSKRFVKQVHLCEEYKIHVINLDKKLFMTCGELSRLLWNEKDSSFLIERLKYKEVDIPFIKLSKESYISLFEQCIYYKIPEYEKLISSNSSLILYSLESAFDVLNVFGHPSICLRLAIKNEKLSFNPSDPIWNEFSYNELDDVSEKSIEEQLNKLCLYDLKAKKEALEIKKMKLFMIKSDSTNEEIKNIIYMQNAIERRMKRIETICSQYSHCS